MESSGTTGGEAMESIAGKTARVERLAATRGCRVEDCALDYAILGAAAGLVVGSAIVAGLPQLGSRCAPSQRIATSAVAAIARAVLGGYAGTLRGGTAVVIGIFSGAIIGSGLGASICR